MRIERFNESVQDNWTEEKMKKLYDDKNDLQDLVLEYLYLYKGKKEFKQPNNYVLEEFWFDEDDVNFENDIFNVAFHLPNKKISPIIYYEFTKNDYQELLMFMNNPELYKNSKKYNL